MLPVFAASRAFEESRIWALAHVRRVWYNGGVMKSWAKIRGAYVLSRRNIKRIIAAISAAVLAFSIATTALSADDESLSRRADAALCTILTIKDSLPSEVVRISVGDDLFSELAELFFMFKPLVPSETSAGRTVLARHVAVNTPPTRRYQTRKTITIAQAAAITGLSKSTIKRLDKDPANTNYPGRNSTAEILMAWAQMHGRDKCAARGVRAANRPRLGHGRG